MELDKSASNMVIRNENTGDYVRLSSSCPNNVQKLQTDESKLRIEISKNVKTVRFLLPSRGDFILQSPSHQEEEMLRTSYDANKQLEAEEVDQIANGDDKEEEEEPQIQPLNTEVIDSLTKRDNEAKKQHGIGKVEVFILQSNFEEIIKVDIQQRERGKTKGKEIDFIINPEFFGINMPQTSSSRVVTKKNVVAADNPQNQTFETNEIFPIEHNENKQFSTIQEQFEDKINIGTHVDIERSDGRIHGAVVTQIKNDNFQVEWREKGETMAKEINIEQIKRVNPELFSTHQMPAALPALSANCKKLGSGSQTARHSTNQQMQPQHLKMQQPSSSSTFAIPMNITNDEGQPDEEEFVRLRRKTHAMVTKREDSAAMARKGAKLKTSELIDIKEKEDFLLDDTKLSPEFPINDIKENEPPILHPAVQPNIMTQKSQLLTNIEEVERNREHRRTQQGNAPKQREMKMQIDPGNSNWEFLAMIRDSQAQLVYRPLLLTDPVVDNRICVCVRKRPLGKKEMINKEVEVVTIPSKDHVIVHQPQVKVDLTKYLVNKKFRFDYAFNEDSDNELVYKFSAQPLVKTIFQRGFATCFAYGQTGSGKTHTMGGIIEGKTKDCTKGIYAMTAADVFAYLHSPTYRNERLSVSCSFFEIYGSKVYDLLAQRTVLRVLEDGKKLVQVVGLKEIKVQNVEEVLKLIKIGSDQRTAGQTSANSNSSRSHAVFQIILRNRENPSEIHGKFSLIDLAGNERGADTISSDRQTRLESGEINNSLLALKECIRAIGRNKQHLPFRESKLTLILRDSFVGQNAKTCMIAMISPGINCVENTMNTLRFADRVKELGCDADEQYREGQKGDEFMGDQ